MKNKLWQAFNSNKDEQSQKQFSYYKDPIDKIKDRKRKQYFWQFIQELNQQVPNPNQPPTREWHSNDIENSDDELIEEFQNYQTEIQAKRYEQ